MKSNPNTLKTENELIYLKEQAANGYRPIMRYDLRDCNTCEHWSKYHKNDGRSCKISDECMVFENLSYSFSKWELNESVKIAMAKDKEYVDKTIKEINKRTPIVVEGSSDYVGHEKRDDPKGKGIEHNIYVNAIMGSVLSDKFWDNFDEKFRPLMYDGDWDREELKLLELDSLKEIYEFIQKKL